MAHLKFLVDLSTTQSLPVSFNLTAGQDLTQMNKLMKLLQPKTLIFLIV